METLETGDRDVGIKKCGLNTRNGGWKWRIENMWSGEWRISEDGESLQLSLLRRGGGLLG